jgi:hypothetical protein
MLRVSDTNTNSKKENFAKRVAPYVKAIGTVIKIK